MSEISEPTAEQCEANAAVTLPDGRTGYAIWYPQMGGYVGTAVVAPDGGGFEAWVWHDGEFPFTGDDPYRESTSPARLHHCNPAQFIGFGRTVERLLFETDDAPKST